MKVKLFAAAIMLCLTTVVQARTSKPEKCPDIKAIRSINVKNNLQDAYDIYWFMDFNDNFNTREVWKFYIGNIKADNWKEAYQETQDVLNNAQLVQGPYQNDINNTWGCAYNGNGHLMFASTLTI